MHIILPRLMATTTLATLLGATQAHAQAVSPSPTTAEQTARSAEGGDIVVTASRRDDTVRNTPTAVSAYSGQRLQEAQIVSLVELASTSPSIQISSLATNVNVTIRAVGNTQINAGSDSGVAVHADGAYLSQSGLSVSTFLDVNRVEILRGPQGTLFGRNATGGAINIIPNYPTSALSAGFEIAGGFDPSLVRSSAFVSGPLSEDGKLRGRVSLQQNYIKGYTRNLATTGPRYQDGLETYSGRAQLQWLPTDAYTVRLLVEHHKEDDSGPAYYNVGQPDPNVPLPPQVIGTPLGSIKKREAYANVGARRVNATTINLVNDLDLGEGHLKMLTSYNEVKQFAEYELDGTAVKFADIYFNQKSHQFFNELLYASPADRVLTFVLGANYFHERVKQDVVVPIAFLSVPITLGGDVKTTAYAAFGQAQYRITAGTKLIAGVRYSHDERAINEYNSFIGQKTQGRSWQRVTYEVGVQQLLGPNVNSYVKYATGYKSGGYSGGSLMVAFNPETNANIEIGLKGSFADGKLQANLALFRMRYENLQVTQVKGPLSAVTNAAKSTVKGIEAEIIARPAAPLRIEFTAAYLDARFDAFLTDDSSRPTLGTLDLSGNRMPQAPQLSGSLGAYVDIPLASSGTLTFGGRVDYKSRVFFSEFNIPISAQDSSAKADLSFRYHSADTRWTASLFATNVTNATTKSNVLITSALLGSVAVAEVLPGRQLGASIGYLF
jgi:iron complex outermembrane recepter protein